MSECEKFEERLNEALDLRQSPREHQALRDHCSQCVECRQLLDGYLKMLDGVAGLSLPMPAPGLVGRIITRFETARSTRRRRVGVLGSLTVAAALFVAAFFGLRSLDTESGPGSEPSVAVRSGPDHLAHDPRADESKTNDPSFADQHSGRAGTAELSQSDDTSPENDADVDLLFFSVLPAGNSSGGSRSATDWVTAMNHGLKPLSDSTSGALDQLTDAFPFDDDSGF